MFRRTMMGAALAALLAPLAFAQTADEIVAKNIQAKGGMEKLKSVKSMRMTGRMVMGQGMEVPLTVMAKRPKMMRTEFTFQGLTGIQAYDGKTGWMVMPFAGKKEPEMMPEEQAKLMDEQAEFDGPLVDYKDKGHKVELVGKEQVEGAETYKLKITRKSGQVSYYYLDAETYLEIKTEGKRSMRGQEFEGESLMGDYKEVDGLMLAHSIESGPKGAPQRQRMVMEKIELNAELPDSLFRAPEGLTPAAAAEAEAGADTAKKETAEAADEGKKAEVPQTAQEGKKAVEAKKPGSKSKP